MRPDAFFYGLISMPHPDPIRFSDTPGLTRQQRAVVLVLVVLVQALLAFAVVRGLGGVQAALREAGLAPTIEAHDVPLDPPAPQPSQTTQSHEAEGAEGAAGRKARATQIVAAPARVPTRTVAAAPAASTGNDTQSGASAAGSGTGGGTAGNGTGSGGSGNGAGGRYVAQRAVKIAGDITSTRDYPKATRTARLGTSVIVVLGVGTDGRVTGCKVHKASGDPQADAITCRLATERFRFRPALDQTGAPVESSYGWEQRFFAP
ncbi:MAG: hypothetical protein RIS94_329 [Pseudomonadota bacterium]|jgi:protein TonB